MAAAMMALGAIALLLAVVSIYALLSFLVTRRTREIGIRVALGATRSRVLVLVVREVLMIVVVGLGEFEAVGSAPSDEVSGGGAGL